MRYIFVLAMAPATMVEVAAPDVGQAIAAATAALPYLGASRADRPYALPTAVGMEWSNVCLLCERLHSPQPGRMSLVAMQEHLVAEHEVSFDEQTHACRVFVGTYKEGCFVWCSPEHGAYSRASWYAIGAPSFERNEASRLFSADQLPVQEQTGRRLFLRPRERRARLIEVQLAGSDEYAWYGFLPGGLMATPLVIWPRSRWIAPLEDGGFPSITLTMLKQYRGLTYAQLADALSISSYRASEIIGGRRTATITREILEALARVLDVSVPACIAAMEASYRAHCAKYYILIPERDPLARFKRRGSTLPETR